MRLKVLSETVERRRAELQPTYYPPVEVDAAALRRELADHIAEVRFDDASKAIYSTDASNYRFIPIGAVVPRNADEVHAAVQICHRHGAPITNRGGGTSLAGQCCNFALIIDTSKYLTKIHDIDLNARTAHVEAGVVLDQLNDQIKPRGFAFGPDPATHKWCTFGGMIGNNACGVHALVAGRSSDNVIDMDVITGDGHAMRVGRATDQEIDRIIRAGGRSGEIYQGLRDIRDRYGPLIRERYPDIPRRVSGYNLDDLLPERGFHVAGSLVGTEGTCVTITGMRVRLIPWPRSCNLLAIGYENIVQAGRAVPEVLAGKPHGLEAIDDRLVQFMRRKEMRLSHIELLPDGRAWLLVEFGGDSAREADDKARDLMSRLEHAEVRPVSMRLYDDRADVQKVWEIRESGLGATAHVPGFPETWPGWEDSAVHPHVLGDYLDEMLTLFSKYDYAPSVYGHFGQGCVHCRLNFDLRTARGLDAFQAFMHEATDLVVKYRGSYSGEHGDGQSRAAFLPKLFGPELMDAMRQFKRLWDPEWRMNPGKVIDPLPITSDLRLGTSFQPMQSPTYYHYEGDHHSFVYATTRCVGVGKCRRREEAFMCPSFEATLDEQHTTRGRARALFEMVHGGLIDDGWKSRAVLQTLELCLGCKGCKRECPVEVDMATYKSEFLAHHYKGRLRPRADYAMGWIHRWARLAAIAPSLANFFAQTRPLSTAAKWMAGVAQQRELPAFARTSFRRWFARRNHRPNAGGEPVMLYPDTFNDYFFPQTLRAALHVLERYGFDVTLPPITPPAVRPLIHYGFLDGAVKHLRRAVQAMRDHAAAGHAIVAVEPSTVSVFRDELPNLLHEDEDGARVRINFHLLTEFLHEREIGLPRIGGRALMHLHCHEKAVLKPHAAHELLSGAGVELTVPEVGCCGMAGSFGYEARHYDVSQTIGEQRLLPAVRALDADAPVLVTGFSCREQIRQGTGRAPMHIAEFLADALERSDAITPSA